MITNLTPEQTAAKYRFQKHIWEGWTVRDFIEYLEPLLDKLMGYGDPFANPVQKTKKDIKDWVRSNLPYTQKALPEVTRYFTDKYDGMSVAPWALPDGRGVLRLR